MISQCPNPPKPQYARVIFIAAKCGIASVLKCNHHTMKTNGEVEVELHAFLISALN
jgi:hypothetical protein